MSEAHQTDRLAQPGCAAASRPTVANAFSGSRNARKLTTFPALNLKTHLLKHLEQILALPVAERLKKRYEKFRAHGQFIEKAHDATEMKPAKANEAIPA